MASTGLGAGVDGNGATAEGTGDGGDSLRKRGVREQIISKLEEAAIVEVHPDRPIKCDWIRGNAIGDHLQGVNSRSVENGRRRRTFPGDDRAAGLDAGAAPIVGAAIIDVSAAIGEAHNRVVAVHLRIIAKRGTLRDAVEQSAGEVRSEEHTSELQS